MPAGFGNETARSQCTRYRGLSRTTRSRIVRETHRVPRRTWSKPVKCKPFQFVVKYILDSQWQKWVKCFNSKRCRRSTLSQFILIILVCCLRWSEKSNSFLSLDPQKSHDLSRDGFSLAKKRHRKVEKKTRRKQEVRGSVLEFFHP